MDSTRMNPRRPLTARVFRPQQWPSYITLPGMKIANAFVLRNTSGRPTRLRALPGPIGGARLTVIDRTVTSTRILRGDVCISGGDNTSSTLYGPMIGITNTGALRRVKILVGGDSHAYSRPQEVWFKRLNKEGRIREIETPQPTEPIKRKRTLTRQQRLVVNRRRRRLARGNSNN